MFNTPWLIKTEYSLKGANLRTVILLMILILTTTPGLHTEALAIPSEPDVIDHVTIQHPGNGFAPSYTLPIYQVGDIRFLSAGVGLEERRANYPSFPLKLIFAQAGGAFVTGVSVTITDLAGKELAKISEDQISGPWLFLDLVPGTYRVTAVRGDGTPIKQTITLQKGESKGIHLHWPAQKTKG